jgi:hypothetical protein
MATIVEVDARFFDAGLLQAARHGLGRIGDTDGEGPVILQSDPHIIRTIVAVFG